MMSAAKNTSASSALLPEKGLDNRPGQNNCFLNVCIQALWHLGAFRSQFLSSKAHIHNETSCIYCVLQALFTNYQFSDEQVLPPTALRTALAVLHRNLDRFQLGELDDAAEALEAILTSLNKVYLVKGREKEKKADESNPNSISNRVFGCPIAEVLQCGKCKTDIKPQGSDSFIYYTYVTEIREGHRRYPDLQFDSLLKRLTDNVKRGCPNENCDEKNCSVRRVLLQQPQVFAVGLVWETSNPSAQEIVEMLSIINMQIRLSNIFDGVPLQFTYQLKGMICYYGLHYDCYFYSSQRRQWLVFDDRVVKEVGASWEELKDRCRRGRFHPSVLFYERVETGVPALPTTYTTPFNHQPITLNRNIFSASGPVPGFKIVASPAYPMRHPFAPYRQAFASPAYFPNGRHPSATYQPYLGDAYQQQDAQRARRKEQERLADEQRRKEMMVRAEAEAELKRKQEQAEEEAKRKWQIEEQERLQKQHRESDASSSDETSEHGDLHGGEINGVRSSPASSLRATSDTVPRSATSYLPFTDPSYTTDRAQSTLSPTTSSPAVLTEDLLATENNNFTAVTSADTSHNHPPASAASSAINHVPSAPPSSLPTSPQVLSSCSEAFSTLPSVPTTLPSPPSSVDNYNNYSTKIDSLSQSKYLSLAKPTYASASSALYSRSSASSLYSSSVSGAATGSFASRTTSSSSGRTAFPSPASASSSRSGGVFADSQQPAATRKKPQQSAFTNLSSLLSD